MSSIESQPRSQTNSSREKTISSRIQRYWEGMGKLNLLAGVRSQEQMEEEQQEALLNQRAENQKVREAAWGFKTPDDVTEEDDMRETVLGDKTTNHHYHHSEAQKKPGSGLGKLALALGLGGPLIAGAVMAPAIIDALKPDPAPVVQPIEDTDTNTEYELQFFED